MIDVNKRQQDIIDMCEKFSKQADQANGAILITFTNGGNTYVDHSCSLQQLASAIASLQAHYSSYYLDQELEESQAK